MVLSWAWGIGYRVYIPLNDSKGHSLNTHDSAVWGEYDRGVCSMKQSDKKPFSQEKSSPLQAYQLITKVTGHVATATMVQC